MIRAILFLIPVALCAQTGAELFRTTCAVAYCHGQNGTAGKAPQLAGRSFTSSALSGIIRNGKPGSGMPSFGKQLTDAKIEAITQYVLSLSGPVHSGPAGPAETKLSPEAEQGRALFFDAVRYGGCGRCHELNNRGVPIGPDLKGSPVTDLRAGSSSRIRLAAPKGEEPFAAIVVEETAARVRVYDLTSKLPVLRTFRTGQVKLSTGAVWSHAAGNVDYSDAELRSISIYLQSIH